MTPPTNIRPASSLPASEAAYSAVAGLVSGLAATGPMTAAMILGHRLLPLPEQYPLPPEEITDQTLREAGVRPSAGLPLLTLCAHFAYGGLAGALFGLLGRKPRPVLRTGAGVGGLVWSLSYLGLLPATGLLSSGWRHPLRRSVLMLAAHFVWGIVLAGLHRLLVTDRARPAPALQRGVRPERD